MYSIGASSPTSRFAANLTAGNALGVKVKSRRRGLLMVTDAIETTPNLSVHQSSFDAIPLTAILILEEQVPRIVEAAGDIPHDGEGGERSGHGTRKGPKGPKGPMAIGQVKL